MTQNWRRPGVSPPPSRHLAILFRCGSETPLARVGARDEPTRNLRRTIDLRVTRIGHLPAVALIPREPVHLLRVGVVGDRPIAGEVLTREPGLPASGDRLFACGHCLPANLP